MHLLFKMVILEITYLIIYSSCGNCFNNGNKDYEKAKHNVLEYDKTNTMNPITTATTQPSDLADQQVNETSTYHNKIKNGTSSCNENVNKDKPNKSSKFPAWVWFLFGLFFVSMIGWFCCSPLTLIRVVSHPFYYISYPLHGVLRRYCGIPFPPPRSDSDGSLFRPEAESMFFRFPPTNVNYSRLP